MKYICVGLGNKGEEYEKTRHNAGAYILQYLVAQEKGIWENDKKKMVQKSHIQCAGESLLLFLPLTYMNESGKAVKKNIQEGETLILLYDDIDIPLGEYKLSFGRSGGSHNGVKSVISSLGTQEFLMVRIGVSPVGNDGAMKRPIGKGVVQDFVMKDFSKRERDIIEKMSLSIHTTLGIVLEGGIQKALSVYKA